MRQPSDASVTSLPTTAFYEHFWAGPKRFGRAAAAGSSDQHAAAGPGAARDGASGGGGAVGGRAGGDGKARAVASPPSAAAAAAPICLQRISSTPSSGSGSFGSRMSSCVGFVAPDDETCAASRQGSTCGC